jgi:hypothetical protein
MKDSLLYKYYQWILSFPNLKTSCHNLICLYLDLVKLTCALKICHGILATKAFPSLHPSLSPYTIAIYYDRHPEEGWTREGITNLHNCSTNILPCEKVGNPCTQEPIIPRKGNWTELERIMLGGKRKRASMGILGLAQTSKVNRPSAMSKTSRTFSHVPWFIRRPCAIHMPTKIISRCTHISLPKSVTGGSVEADGFQHVGRGTVKRKFIKTITIMLAQILQKLCLITVLQHTQRMRNHRIL